ncbi:MAG: methyltransferase domain-containing protein [Planctomycetes bacterium]|nr:methyltransferase domain-containing protein [Planctomycetota bacterium]
MKSYHFGRSPRAIAAFVCHIANGTSQRAKDLLEHELERSGFDRRDRDLATELAYGTLRQRGTLDHLLAQFSSLPLKRIQPQVLEVLRIGAYQLLFLDKVPAPAAVSEAVEMAKRVSSRGAVGFVNACLRALHRAIVAKESQAGDDPRRALPVGDDAWCVFDRPVLPDPRRALAAWLAAAHSHPLWLVRRWLGRFGEAATRRLCEMGNRHAGLALRVNRLRATRDGLVAELVKGGRWAKPLGADHVVIDPAGSLADLAALRDGLCTVQGVAASAAPALLAPQPGELLLDVCSAPGSKACQLAELARGEARVVALDVSPKRLRQVAANIQRLGARTVWPVAGDGAACERLFRAAFDAALVDVPCSNTGVLARRVESRWRLSAETIAGLAELQGRLLASAAAAVRPGGRLVYSTCSLEQEENEQAVESFCREQAAWRLAEARYILPHETGDDGGYVALLRRTAE